MMADPNLYSPSQIDGSGGTEREVRAEEKKSRSRARVTEQEVRVEEIRSRSRSRDIERELSWERDSRHSDDNSDGEYRGPISRRYKVAEVDNDSSPVYSFTPSRTSRGVSVQGSRYEEDNSSEKVQVEARPRIEKRLPNASHVFESQYTGESCLGGPHAANLTVVTSTKVQYHPLFQWM